MPSGAFQLTTSVRPIGSGGSSWTLASRRGTKGSTSLMNASAAESGAWDVKPSFVREAFRLAASTIESPGVRSTGAEPATPRALSRRTVPRVSATITRRPSLIQPTIWGCSS